VSHLFSDVVVLILRKLLHNFQGMELDSTVDLSDAPDTPVRLRGSGDPSTIDSGRMVHWKNCPQVILGHPIEGNQERMI
jgi:hypothetical protein